MRHRIKARLPRDLSAGVSAKADARAPRIERDAGIVSSFLSDAAHVPGGFASGVAFPHSEGEVAALVAGARQVLPVGAQSSLTGGATPRGDVVVSTRALQTVAILDERTVKVGAGVPLAELQRHLAPRNLYYPPVPTFDGAFAGGTISTNAAGPATFKYGAARQWVSALSVVLADGAVLDVTRGETTASDDGTIEVEHPSGALSVIPIPTYVMPDVAKLSAGYYSRPGMDLIDLFIGSEGTLGIITEAVVRVVPLPRRCAVLVSCASDAQAITVTDRLRREAQAAWRGNGPLDVAAIEYMDAAALRAAGGEAFARAGITPRYDETVMLLVQLEVGDEDAALNRLTKVLDDCGVAGDPLIASPGDDRAMQRLFQLRESVPAGVNAIVAAAKKSASPAIEKTAGDLIVPFGRLAESIARYRAEFEERGVPYAIWGHVSDGNLHANVVPASLADVERGREAILAMARAVIAMGGSPLAEHGVGRSPLKQQLLCELYGDEGIEQMRRVKRALDPEWKLSPGVLFSS